MKLKLVNPKRLFVSISIIIITVLGIIFFTNTNSFSHSEIAYKTVTVISGDTLWSIALSEQQYNPYYANKDVRYIIEDIKSKNNLNTSNLYAGDVLSVPAFM